MDNEKCRKARLRAGFFAPYIYKKYVQKRCFFYVFLVYLIHYEYWK